MIVKFISKHFEIGNSLLSHDFELTESNGSIRSYKCRTCSHHVSFHMTAIVDTLKRKSSNTVQNISVESCDRCLKDKMDTAIA